MFDQNEDKVLAQLPQGPERFSMVNLNESIFLLTPIYTFRTKETQETHTEIPLKNGPLSENVTKED